MGIKYYESDTWYAEGAIHSVLDKYIFRRFGHEQNPTVTLVRTLEMDGDPATKIAMLEAINNTDNKLILLPFNPGNHFVGFAIDLKNKKALYIDPFGNSTTHYKKTQLLITEFQEKGITVDVIETRQQTDGSSCGPILAASMIKCIEDFVKKDEISSQGFKASKSILATDRMIQMYVCNTTSLNYWELYSDQLILVSDNVMLADLSLWKAFFGEKGSAIHTDIRKQIYEIIEHQKSYINQFDTWHEHTEAEKCKIFFIKQFQSKLTELILLGEEHKIGALIEQHRQFFHLKNEEDIILSSHSILLSDLFSDENLPETLAILESNTDIPNIWVRNKNRLLLVLASMMATIISVVSLAILGSILSPWLAIPCASLLIVVLIGIKIMNDEYQLNNGMKNKMNCFAELLDKPPLDTNPDNELIDTSSFSTDKFLDAPEKLENASKVKKWFIGKISEFLYSKKSITVAHQKTNITFSHDEIRLFFSGMQEKLMIVKKEDDFLLKWDISHSGKMQYPFFEQKVKLEGIHDSRPVLLIQEVCKRFFDEKFISYEYTPERMSIVFNLEDIHLIMKNNPLKVSEEIDLDNTQDLNLKNN